MAKHKDPSVKPRFQVGDTVRVKKGIRDPDFPDVTMGGWVGTVKEVDAAEGQVVYCVGWSPETLANAPPIFRKRCERDGLDYEQTYLGEDDLEPYGGEPLSIEQPTSIQTPELSPDDQDDRIRVMLDLTGDDPLPDVNQDTLRQYWGHLAHHLRLPFEARHCPEDEPDQKVTVIGLPNPDNYDCDEFYGLLCEARLGKEPIAIPLGEIKAKKGNENHQLIDDYAYWFWNWR